MIKRLQIFQDGTLSEVEEDTIFKVTETKGQVDLLIEALQFTQAETFTVTPDDAVPPSVPEPRASIKTINAEGLRLLQSFEGLYLEAYLDPVNIWTIGWGATEGVYKGMKITKAQAEEILKKELSKFEAAVAKAVKVQINDNQHSALVCFSYNVGARALFKSTLLALLNQGKYQEAADQFLRWDKARGQALLGLSRRRRAEQSLFLSKPWEWAKTWEPTRVLRLAAPGQPLIQGDDVIKLQQALVKAGFSLKVDGYFGNDTDVAVKQFQQKKGLTVDGDVGPKTLQALGL
ncbi:glycoside hydrolase family protein [Nodularia harveyana UHCC-0300]|uniref:Lysozyme n=1 Tax=Nodularia harveyana UHCC-0300 TaxID=2974287 RepID=A0ABU5UDW5_9CYAN|nr:glycoside hydrolase family protein [Nodularia harveyana]MEA5581692.1 glycoside hydrolase family protein [Nodularia harveyana UHCC-0300]